MLNLLFYNQQSNPEDNKDNIGMKTASDKEQSFATWAPTSLQMFHQGQMHMLFKVSQLQIVPVF